MSPSARNPRFAINQDCIAGGRAPNGRRFAPSPGMLFRFWLYVLAAAVPAAAGEADALAISQNIQALHFPHATLLDPIFDSPTGTRVVGYTRCGDSAIWTGHYLAAEAFRYKVTGSPDALNAARRAFLGIEYMLNV